MSSVITIDDESQIAYIQKRLGDISDKAPKVLANALNDSAKQAQRVLAKKAQETYAVKTGGFNKALTVRRASRNHLAAELYARGSPIGLSKFQVSPASVQKTGNRPTAIKVHVLKAGSMKSLQEGNLKAFVAKFMNGHVAVAQRTKDQVPVKSLRTRFHIKELFSLSIPQMLGSEARVYGIVQPEIQKTLQANIDREIHNMLYTEGKL